jgi:hypothetical protein
MATLALWRYPVKPKRPLQRIRQDWPFRRVSGKHAIVTGAKSVFGWVSSANPQTIDAVDQVRADTD